MATDFSETMSQRSDKQLAEILTIKRHEYQDEAIQAAQSELEKRNLDLTALITVDELKQAEKEQIPIEKKDQKLSGIYKFFAFSSVGIIAKIISLIVYFYSEFWFLLILTIPISIMLQVYVFKKLKELGYETMAVDLKKWILNVWIFYASIFLLVELLKLFDIFF